MKTGEGRGEVHQKKSREGTRSDEKEKDLEGNRKSGQVKEKGEAR